MEVLRNRVKELEESESMYKEHLHLITDAMHDMIRKLDKDLIIQYASPSHRKYGYEPDALIGRSAVENIHPEDRERILAAVEKAIGERTSWVETYRFRCGNGRYIWSEASGTIIYDEQGAMNGMVVVSRDISDRKLTEEALRFSENLYRTIFENTGGATAIIDEDKTVILTNEEMTKITGYPRKEIEGKKKWTDIIVDEERDRIAEYHALRRVDPSMAPKHYNTRIWDVRGDTREVFTTVAVIPGTKRTVVSLLDVTSHKRLEAQLLHAQKMEAVGTLAGGIAHDFNNLLMGIQGHTSLMLLGIEASHPHYERLKQIEEHVSSAAELTQQLLGFARGGRFAAKATCMNVVVEKTARMFGRTKKEIVIHFDFEKSLWNVEADPGQLEQMLMNLYVNAWQAMPAGGELDIETRNIVREEDDPETQYKIWKKYVKISVTDNGVGMDEKTRQRIFEPFFTTKEMGRGTGLGLAMVYGIIKGHKGQINVYSEPGHGTTFNIYLPVSEREIEAEKDAEAELVRGGESILLVDDEKTVLEVNKELLESLGYRVYVAGSGQEALAVYLEKRQHIDLVILDMIMPGISGLETFARLREINPVQKVVLSSGYSMNGMAKEIMEKGCNRFLQKPFHIRELSKMIRDVLGKD